MKVFIVLCLASLALASKLEGLANQELTRAKQALDELTFTKEDHIYDIEGYVKDGENEMGYENEIDDPCADFDCKIGWECVVDRINREPFCDCAKSCPRGNEKSKDGINRNKVCSTTNTTFDSRCEFHRQKCLQVELTGVQIDYYGECSVINNCTVEDLKEYPVRMTDWLKKSMDVMRSMPEEHGGLTQRERENAQWGPETDAIFWKFDRLDKNPADRYLDFAELEPLRAPLALLEPCTMMFLENCDQTRIDDEIVRDGLISALEFGRCLNLTDAQIPY